MRVLLVGNFLSGAGKGVAYCEDLAIRLRTRGHLVLTTSHEPRRIMRLANMAATVISRRRDYALAHVDVYSGAAFTWAEVVTLILHRLGKPMVLSLHGGALPSFAHRHPQRVRRLLARASAVTAPSLYLCDALRTYRPDIHHLPNGIAVDEYAFLERKKVGPRLVWLRAFHRVYDPDTAVRCLPAVLEVHPAATLTMVGPDKHDGTRKALEHGISALGLADHVRLQDGVPRSRVASILGDADILVNTALVDNTPVSVLEAMACGLCVVSTNVGGIPHLVHDGSDALLVGPGDAPAFSRAILRILADPGLSARLSRNGRRTAEQFDWSVVLPQWDALFRAVS